ncbi:DoxX family protein [Nonomuraea sp. NBC_00507]|uniref:DoxX family protein n=1 Tax=Nonomuraea sp. NBC_00507 TaxID=2976002 RepID=UPI002E179A8B
MVQVLVAVYFVAAAYPKLAGINGTTEMFSIIGLGQWFRYLTGGLEIAGAIGLLIPRLCGLAALALTALMICAIATQAFILHNGLLGPTIPAIACAVIGWARWPGNQLIGRSGRAR